MKETGEVNDRIDLDAAFREKLTLVANEATDADKALFKEIMKLAKSERRFSQLFTLSPPVCALLFLNCNGHNRDFSPQYAEELARRMAAGLWKPNNASIGFYVDGDISDGQHRLAGAVWSGFALEDYVVVFGMTRSAIDTVDSPKMRDGASHAKLDGIQDTNTKQAIVKDFAAYMVRAGQPTFALRSASEIKLAIEENDGLLNACIRIGAESVKGRISPVFKASRAASVAYLMIRNGWREQTAREKLALFQSGESQDGEFSPFFLAAKVIDRSRKAREAKDRLTGVKELGVVIYAMIQTERGINATKEATIRGEVKGKTVPNPRYPTPPEQQEAA
jgi:hypothetical protein